MPTSFQDLGDDLLRVASLTAHYAESATDWRGQSAAQLDSVDIRFSGDWASRPGLEITLLAARCLTVCADTIEGMAVTLPADRLLYTPLLLIRPTMSAAARCAFLVDPSIDFRERVRRWANLMLESSVEQVNLASDDVMARHSAEERLARYENSAVAFGFKVSTKKAPGLLLGARYIDKQPSEMGMIGRLWADDPMGRTMYRLTSALVHVQSHGQMALLMTQEAVGSDHPGVSNVPSGITLQDAALWHSAAVLAVHRAVSDFLLYRGKSVNKWQQEIADVMKGWRILYSTRPGVRG